jgi:hypothetical protein
MTRNRLNAAILALVVALMAIPDRAAAQSTDPAEDRRAKTGYSFSYTPIYQFETDLDSGGSFDVQRHFLRFDIATVHRPTLDGGPGTELRLRTLEFFRHRRLGRRRPVG